jgi:NhaP-type Na+/H+ or K+/H+ antiporter
MIIGLYPSSEACQATIIDTEGYVPTINVPAIQMSNVNDGLNQSINIMHSLELNTIVLCIQPTLFSKAAEVVWKHLEKFKGITLRLGVFHTICTLLSSVGKRFQGGDYGISV